MKRVGNVIIGQTTIGKNYILINPSMITEAIELREGDKVCVEFYFPGSDNGTKVDGSLAQLLAELGMIAPMEPASEETN